MKFREDYRMNELVDLRDEILMLLQNEGLEKKDLEECLGERIFENPFSRESIIKTCIFLGCGLKTCNRLITKGTKRSELYIKGMKDNNSWDFSWIYLIEWAAASENMEKVREYDFDKLHDIINEIIKEELAQYDESTEIKLCQNDGSSKNITNSTTILMRSLTRLKFSEDYSDIRNYLSENFGSFRTAYAKGYSILQEQRDRILKLFYDAAIIPRESCSCAKEWGIISDVTQNLMGGKFGICKIMNQPQLRENLITLCLEMRCSKEIINMYLKEMGFAFLGECDISRKEESFLMEAIDAFENNHNECLYYMGRRDIPKPKLDPIKAEEIANSLVKYPKEIKQFFQNKCEKGFKDKNYICFPYEKRSQKADAAKMTIYKYMETFFSLIRKHRIFELDDNSTSKEILCTLVREGIISDSLASYLSDKMMMSSEIDFRSHCMLAVGFGFDQQNTDEYLRKVLLCCNKETSFFSEDNLEMQEIESITGQQDDYECNNPLYEKLVEHYFRTDKKKTYKYTLSEEEEKEAVNLMLEMKETIIIQ